MDYRERVINTLNYSSVDRPPLFDIITNDKVISYYVKEELTVDNTRKVMARAFDKCIDSTRQEIIIPQPEEVVRGERGETWKKVRWTSWHIKRFCETANNNTKDKERRGYETKTGNCHLQYS